MNRGQTNVGVKPEAGGTGQPAHPRQAEQSNVRIARAQTPAKRKPGLLRRGWNLWIKFAETLGNIQMVLILSLTYWTVLAVMAVPFKLFSDPLAIRRSRRHGWIKRQPVAHTLETMKNQY